MISRSDSQNPTSSTGTCQTPRSTFSTPVVLEAMFRIERQSDGRTTIFRLSGRIQSAHIEDIQEQIGDGVGTILDLCEVTLVDVGVVRFLSKCEKANIGLIH